MCADAELTSWHNLCRFWADHCIFSKKLTRYGQSENWPALLEIGTAGQFFTGTNSLTSPIMFMVITCLLLPKNKAEEVKHLGQFWVGVNGRCTPPVPAMNTGVPYNYLTLAIHGGATRPVVATRRYSSKGVSGSSFSCACGPCCASRTAKCAISTAEVSSSAWVSPSS